MDTYRTLKLEPDQYTILHGSEKHEVEIPFAEALDLWVEWKADRDVIVWLYFEDGKRVPYTNGLRGHFSIRTRGVISVVLVCTKSTTVAACVSWKDLAVTEKKDWTPVEIVPPSSAELKLSQAVQRELARLGVYNESGTIDVSEEDNLEEDDEADEFGEGFMEAEVPVPLSRAEPGGNPAKKGGASKERGPGDADGGDSPKSDGDPAGGKPRLDE